MRALGLSMPLIALLAGCNLAPHYVRPSPPVPMQFPQGAADAPLADQPVGVPWQMIITDARLREVVTRALANNRDLRAAVTNIASARASYRVARSAGMPTIDGSANAAFQGGFVGTRPSVDGYSAGVGISGFEIDLFGRLRNQTAADFEQYLATIAGLVAASGQAYRMSEARYRAGIDTFLNTLTAQRALYAAQQTEVASTLADFSNRVTLYQVIASDDPD